MLFKRFQPVTRLTLRNFTTSPNLELLNIVVGQIKDIQKHPQADRLQVCQVSVGQEKVVQIVCGATNVAKGQKVPVALLGAKVVQIGRSKKKKIKKSKMRGEESHGMICSGGELGLEDHDNEGIMVLDSEADVGSSFENYLLAQHSPAETKTCDDVSGGKIEDINTNSMKADQSSPGNLPSLFSRIRALFQV